MGICNSRYFAKVVLEFFYVKFCKTRPFLGSSIKFVYPILKLIDYYKVIIIIIIIIIIIRLIYRA